MFPQVLLDLQIINWHLFGRCGTCRRTWSSRQINGALRPASCGVLEHLIRTQKPSFNLFFRGQRIIQINKLRIKSLRHILVVVDCKALNSLQPRPHALTYRGYAEQIVLRASPLQLTKTNIVPTKKKETNL